MKIVSPMEKKYRKQDWQVNGSQNTVFSKKIRKKEKKKKKLKMSSTNFQSTILVQSTAELRTLISRVEKCLVLTLVSVLQTGEA